MATTESAFFNGLTPDEANELTEIRIEIMKLIPRIERLPRHRSMSLAVTKLDEANHWLRDRSHRAA